MEAFSRAVDDAVDGEGSLEVKQKRLIEWRLCLGQVYAINPRGFGTQQSLVAELSRAVRRFEIPQSYFDDLLKGVELDLVKSRYENFKELETYCYYVAGTIGLICNAIFGERTEHHRRYAVTLGTAFQLTNIIRDVASDYVRGRIYLPTEELGRFGLQDTDLVVPGPDPRRKALMGFQIARAREYFRKAREALGGRGPLAAEIMTAIYYKLLCTIEKEGFDAPGPGIRLPLWQRFRAAIGVWRTGCC